MVSIIGHGIGWEASGTYSVKIDQSTPPSPLLGPGSISNQDPHSVSKSWTWIALSINTRQSQRQTGKFTSKFSSNDEIWYYCVSLWFHRSWSENDLVCHPKYHPLADYHQFTTRMIKSIYVFRSMDRVYLFSRLELTINWIAFSIELIYCTDKGAAYGKKLLKTVLISVRCRARSLPFKTFKSLLEK